MFSALNVPRRNDAGGEPSLDSVRFSTANRNRGQALLEASQLASFKPLRSADAVQRADPLTASGEYPLVLGLARRGLRLLVAVTRDGLAIA